MFPTAEGTGANEDDSKKGGDLLQYISSFNRVRPFFQLLHSRVGLNKSTAQYISVYSNSASLLHRFILPWLRCFIAVIFQVNVTSGGIK